MTLGDKGVQEMWLADPALLDHPPNGVLEADIFRSRNSPGGPFSAAEIAYFATHGRALEAWHSGGQTGVAPPFAPSEPTPAPIPAPGLPPSTLEAYVLVPVGALSVGDPH